MMKMDVILSGLGGQGVLFITKIISLSAIKKGYKVLAAETHGMAQRGGSVVSHLRVGDNNNCSLINIRSADFIISLEENEAFRNIHFLARGGKIYTNTLETIKLNKEINQYLNEQNIEYNTINASKIVNEFSAPLSLNLAVLGYFFSFDNKILTKNEVRETIQNISPKKFRKINVKIFDECSK